jgi:hypothetical protein
MASLFLACLLPLSLECFWVEWGGGKKSGAFVWNFQDSREFWEQLNN